MLRELYKLMYELIELYECTSEGSYCLQKRFDGVLFSSSLHVIPKVSVLNHNTALSAKVTRICCNSAFPYKAPPAVSEWIYRDLHLLTSI